MRKTIACWILAICTMAGNAHAQTANTQENVDLFHAYMASAATIGEAEYQLAGLVLMQELNNCVAAHARVFTGQLKFGTADQLSLAEAIPVVPFIINDAMLSTMACRNYANWMDAFAAKARTNYADPGKP